MKKPHSFYMKSAIDQAERAKSLGELPFGCVIAHDGKIIGIGKCENNTTGDVTDHAEMLAIRNACKTLKINNLNGCIIYCTNEPCPMCAAAIFQAKISTVYISLTRDDLPNLLRPRKIKIFDLAKDSGYKISIKSGLLKEEVQKLFKDIS